MTKKPKFDRLLTEVELEIMNAIWRLERCTIRDVVDQLPKERPLAYTSVATMIKILEQKGAIHGVKKDKVHFYEPRLSKEDYEAKTLLHLADKLFAGSPSSMVMRLLDEAELGADELKAIRSTLEEKLKSETGKK